MKVMLGAVCVLIVASSTVEVIERHQDKSHWKQLGRAPAGVNHEVTVAIRQKTAQLEQELIAVSTLGNSKYGKHLSFEQVGELIDTAEASERVLNWLLKQVAGSVLIKKTKRGEYIRVSAPLSSWESALGTSFFEWTDGTMNVHRCEKYRLPQEVASDVAAIFNTVDFPAKLNERPQLKAPQDNGITPATLNHFYRIDSNTASHAASQAVFETIGQTMSSDDLTKFQQQFGLPVQPVADVVGGHDNKTCVALNSCAEANLDVQYIMAIAQGSPTTYFYDSNTSAPFLDYMLKLADESNPPLVNSISYGAPEQALDVNIMDGFNTEVMKLGAMGVSVFVSSGDDGAPGRIPSSSSCGYQPSYPATAPHVTAVGATWAADWSNPGQGEEAQTGAAPQNAVITTGGGFSSIWAPMDFAKSAIAEYLTRDTPKTGFESRGRGYPDVSLTGYNYAVVIGGNTYQVSGTSASAPSVAGMVTLINAIRLEAGSSAVGYLNPTIYGNPSIFNDVTKGDNKCTSRGNVCCEEGFTAVQGWDPATGMGSVDFTNLKNLLTSHISPEKLRQAEQRLLAKTSVYV